MLDIVRFLSDCASRYGLNNIVAEGEGSSSESSKRKLEFDSEEVRVEFHISECSAPMNSSSVLLFLIYNHLYFTSQMFFPF